MTLEELRREERSGPAVAQREARTGPFEAWIEELRGSRISYRFPRCLPQLAQEALAHADGTTTWVRAKIRRTK